MIRETSETTRKEHEELPTTGTGSGDTVPKTPCSRPKAEQAKADDNEDLFDNVPV